MYSDHVISPDGAVIEEGAGDDSWLPSDDDRAFITSLMRPHYEPGKMASWIASPARGVHTKPVDYEYVRL